ncbi:MAG: T9SS type A sorting domain-containing protein [Bacteroidetes bacterium]|nr:T9SS type A sorting domain-containing protein [Bacteroidota bacterium]
MHPTDPNTLVMGKSQIYFTTNGGSSWSQMGNISGANSKFIAIAIAPSDPQTLYAATAHEFFVTSNGGNSWNLAATSTDAITYIAVSPNNPQQVWVTNSGYTSGEKVYTTNDGGNNWVNFSGSLPNIPVNCIVFQNGSNDGLYIGTDLGVFYRDNNMNDWIQYNNGLPNVIVNELEISYNNNKLWAATFGRGLWRSDLYNSVGVEENEVYNNFIISPNPTKDVISIQGELKFAKSVKINLTNTIGQTVLSKEIKAENNFVNEQLDLKFLNNGFYFLNIDSENSRHTYKVQKLD